MEQFTVPQFERETPIVGPLTFKQFIFIGAAGGICLILYFILPFFLFVLSVIILVPMAFALAFLKSGGRPLPTVLKNFFLFSLSSKIYLWRKKGGLPPKIIEKVEKSPEEVKKASVPTVIGKSRLKNLSTQVETKIQEER